MVLDRPGTPLLYSWIPPLSGDFEVIVHELKRRMTGSAHFPIVKGQKGDEGRVKVVDKEGHNSQLQIVREIAHMPPCQTVQNRRDLYTVWDGSWLGVRNKFCVEYDTLMRVNAMTCILVALRQINTKLPTNID